MASLRVRTEIARLHVLDHPLTQRTDDLRTHRQLLSWDEVDNPSILKTGFRPHYRRSQLWLTLAPSPVPPLAIAQRFSAVARFDRIARRSIYVWYWGNCGHGLNVALADCALMTHLCHSTTKFAALRAS
jgi:hypothetical protein